MRGMTLMGMAWLATMNSPQSRRSTTQKSLKRKPMLNDTWRGWLWAALLFLPLFSLAQVSNEGLITVEFNAPFSNTKCEYLDELNDCDKLRIDISKDAKAGPKYKIAVVPTLIIFKDGEEVARFQANIMMQLDATREEVQEKIDEILMEDF